MHIAVCDDNVADRKQLERLLGRESDKRKADTGVFYTDSFGDCEALISNPMSYDLFFLDLITGEMNGLAIALKLREIGVTAPIVLCSSSINYPDEIASLKDYTDNFMHLNKPILVSELSNILDRAIHMQQNRVPSIELRSDKDTFYVQEDDIVYAVSEGNYINVFLKDGTMVPILTNMDNFCQTLSIYTHMLLLTRKSIINIAYLENVSPFQVTLKNNITLKSSPFAQKYIKSALQEYHAEQP